jgi:PAS domain S-box-containing protein
VIRLEREVAGDRRAEDTVALADAARERESDLSQRCLEIASVMLLAIDAQGRVVFVNPHGVDILGYARKEDIIGRDWFEHFLPQRLRQPVRRVFDQLMRCELPGAEDYENPVLRPDGDERVVTWHNSLLRGPTGHINGVLCSGQDVTETRRVEGALRARERQQAAVAALGQRALTSTDFQSLLDMATGSIAEVLSVAYCKVLELRPGGADFILRAGVGWRPSLVGAAIVGAHRESQAGYTLESREPVIVEDLRTETRFRGPALLSEHDVVSGLSCAIPGSSGRPWGVLGAHTQERRKFSRDDINFLLAVANILAAVIERSEATRVLRERDADLRRAQALGHIGSWRMNVRSNELTWSAENHRIFGVPQGVPMTYETFLAIVHPDDRDTVDRMWEAALRGQPYDVEHRLLVGGQVKWVRERAEIEFAENGALLGGFGTTQDITEHKRSEAALKEADRQKDEFLAMLAHELRNPLTPILNAAQVLAMLKLSDPNVRWAAEVIERQVTHLTRLVDDLLDVSRIARGKIKLQQEPIELTAIARQSVEGVRAALDAKGQRLELRLPQRPLWLRGDPVRLVQVLVNALHNAAKYSPNGADVELTVGVAGQEAEIQVRDNGSGIPRKLLPRVFDLFQQGECNLDRRESGLGIGLTVVRRVVELHGGRVTVESPGIAQGTTLTIYLPLDPMAAAPVDKISASPSTVPSMRVLVVDDERVIAKSMALVLRGLGHDVCVANCGEDAVAQARSFRPQLVLLDIGLPGMDGWETARALRQLPEGPGMRLVAVTGYGDEPSRRRSRAAGFDAHLVKPVVMAQLTALFAERAPSSAH